MADGFVKVRFPFGYTKNPTGAIRWKKYGWSRIRNHVIQTVFIQHPELPLFGNVLSFQ